MPRTTVRYRRCRPRDLLPSLRLVMFSFNDVRRRTGKEPIVRRVREVPGFFAHLLATNPESFFCAWRGKRIIGFAGAIIRGKQWYLGWLFVHPRYQDQGIGRRLLTHVWRDGTGMSHSLTTMTYNMQAVGLYSRFGMVPETLFTVMETRPDRLRTPMPTGLDVVEQVQRADLAWINDVETEIRGYAHRGEWRFWRRSDQHRILLFKRARIRIGYSMITWGIDIAPVGAARRRDLHDVLAETLRIAATSPRKGKKDGKLMVLVPEAQKDLYQFLLECGFRNREMLLFMSDQTYPDFGRYLPASPAVF